MRGIKQDGESLGLSLIPGYCSRVLLLQQLVSMPQQITATRISETVVDLRNGQMKLEAKGQRFQQRTWFCAVSGHPHPSGAEISISRW